MIYYFISVFVSWFAGGFVIGLGIDNMTDADVGIYSMYLVVAGMIWPAVALFALAVSAGVWLAGKFK